MSDIVLTAAVRQNLLSLQGTADLLSKTQTRLATGKKVNSALDNPTNYFTAAGLDARAGDISNLLDSIGNGVQVLQAANTGITSLQKLVDTAKSIANQALQQPTGYSTKSSIKFTGTGTGVPPAGPATAADLTTSKLNGGVFTFTSSAGTAVTITIGTAAAAFDPIAKTATVKTLDQLNTALAVAGVNLSASITGHGRADLHVDQRRCSSDDHGHGGCNCADGARRDQHQRQRARWRRRQCGRCSGSRCGVANRARHPGQPVQSGH